MRKNRIFVAQITGKGSVKMTEPNKYVFVLRRFIGTANAYLDTGLALLIY